MTRVVVAILQSVRRLVPVCALTFCFALLTVSLLRAQGSDDANSFLNNSTPSHMCIGQNTLRRATARNAFRSDVDLVLVPVIVTDTWNRPVTYLRKEDFQLYDNGTPQDITYFAQEDTPLSIGILLDTSGSMKSKFDIAAEAVSQFFNNANRNDDYFIITYSTRPTLWADSTQSIESLEQRVAAIQPDGSTPLLDAIYLGLSKVQQGRHERRALLIISDGGDNNSRYSAREIREVAQESDVQIFAMGVFSPLTLSYEDWSGKKLLSEIAEATGGRAAIVSRWTSLPDIATDISHALRAQYLLAYKPRDKKHDGTIHKLALKTTCPKYQCRFQLYYKRQYLAPKE